MSKDYIVKAGCLVQVNPQAQEIVIGSEVTALTDACFAGCTKLRKVIFNCHKCTSFGCRMTDCIELEEVVMPMGITHISNAVFRGLEKLRRVEFTSARCKEIGSYAFYNCISLCDINLAFTETIGESAFFGCKALSEVDFGKISSIGDFAFSESGVERFIKGSGELTLGYGSFKNCEKLVRVDLRGCNVSEYPDECFSYCTSLEVCLSKNTVKTVGNRVLYGDKELISVGESFVKATSMGDAVFGFCYKLMMGVTIYPQTEVTRNTFDDADYGVVFAIHNNRKALDYCRKAGVTYTTDIYDAYERDIRKKDYDDEEEGYRYRYV